MSELVLALAQINTTVGDLDGNSRKILEYVEKADRAGADIVIFPELSLTGYPPEDMLLKAGFLQESMGALEEVARQVGDVVAVVGYVERDYDTFNSAAVLNRGCLVGNYRKTFLPNYGVFDEKRYFGTGDHNTILEIGGVRAGLTVCEDIWYPGGPMDELVAWGGAELIINISASPFNRGKHEYRERLISARSMDGFVVLAYVNSVGGQDELVFDGGSCVHHPQHGFLLRAGRFSEALAVTGIDFSDLSSARMLEPRFRYASATSAHKETEVVELEKPAGEGRASPPLGKPAPPDELSTVEEITEALVTGLRDYVRKNGFEEVVLGLSGGIDSALTAALAVRALGHSNVICVFLPSHFTSASSREGAKKLAGNLGVELLDVPIDHVFEAISLALEPTLGESREGPAFENLQARIRGNILMALSNRFGWLVLATGNKSELSMGYCTLYGDMAGGFALLKDLLKTQVYEVSRYLNEEAGYELIPDFIIEREPTAELKEGQRDTDSLPPYEVLDPVLEAYVEHGMDPHDIVAMGFSEELVRRVVTTVDANEYKRRQAPVGVKITSRAFGRDWRMPISNRLKWEGP